MLTHSRRCSHGRSALRKTFGGSPPPELPPARRERPANSPGELPCPAQRRFFTPVRPGLPPLGLGRISSAPARALHHLAHNCALVRSGDASPALLCARRSCRAQQSRGAVPLPQALRRGHGDARRAQVVQAPRQGSLRARDEGGVRGTGRSGSADREPRPDPQEPPERLEHRASAGSTELLDEGGRVHPPCKHVGRHPGLLRRLPRHAGAHGGERWHPTHRSRQDAAGLRDALGRPTPRPPAVDPRHRTHRLEEPPLGSHDQPDPPLDDLRLGDVLGLGRPGTEVDARRSGEESARAEARPGSAGPQEGLGGRRGRARRQGQDRPNRAGVRSAAVERRREACVRSVRAVVLVAGLPVAATDQRQLRRRRRVHGRARQRHRLVLGPSAHVLPRVGDGAPHRVEDQPSGRSDHAATMGRRLHRRHGTGTIPGSFELGIKERRPYL